jgi:putative ABC transport system permease protein
VETVFQDLRHGVRAFRQSLGFTVTAIVALALGIGASTAIFSLLSAVLLRPLPFPEPERVVIFRTTGDYGGSPASPAKFNFLRDQTRTFQDISAFRFGVSIFDDGSNSERVPSAQVSADFFRLFGIPPIEGRTFLTQEDVPGGGRVVVLSHRMWMRWFGGDRSAIGKTIPLNGERYQVIGILTPSADGEAFPDGWQSEGTADVWLPIQIDSASKDDSEYFTAAGRLRPGVTLAMAKAQMPVLAQQFRRRFPGDLTMGPKNGFAILPIREMLSGDIGEELWILAGAVGFVLLIACANVASLLLMRATGRKREVAIRAAMGASRGRIVRQLLTESVMLSTIGGALGLIVGMIGIRWLLTMSPGNIPHIGENGSAVTADWRVLGFSLLVALGTGVVFGMFPALEVSRVDLNEALKASGRRSGFGYRQSKIRSFLVTSEVMLALVLLTGAGLLIRTLVTVRSMNPGFDTNNVLAIQMSLNGPRFQKAAAVSALVRDSLERIRALRGVIAAAHTCCLPLTGSDIDGAVVIVGRPVSNLSHEWARAVTVSPDYFDVLKIPLLRGRMFTDRDKSGAEPVVMINDAMARRFWRGTDDPLRASLEFEDLPGLPPRRIVGVVASAREIALTAEPQATVYFPVAQTPDSANTYILRTPVAWVIRTELSSHALSSAIQRELMQASGGVPLGKVRLMNEVLRDSTADRSFEMLLLSIFAGAALFLAAIGIYGLMAYAVEQRTQEIGVRMALGAESNDVRNMVVWQGMRLALAGVGMGMAAALVLRRVMENLVWGVDATDPVVFLSVPLVLSGVALLAVWIPARGASRTDPVEALRQE